MTKKNLLKKSKGITLVALVVTIVVLIILATISISVVFGENGILERAIQGQDDYTEGEAREKLTLALGDLAIDRETDLNNYNENEYIDNALENQGMIVNDNIVVVDGWQFEISREELKVTENLGKGQESKEIEIAVTSTTSSDYTKATIKVEITYEGELSSLKIGQEEITELTKEDGKYVIEVDVTDNKAYTIFAKDTENNYRLEKVEVKDVSTDLDIYTKEQLVAFRDRVNNGATYEGRTVNLKADIDLNKGKYEVKEDGTITFNDAEQWTPIANYGVNNTLKFSGTFEGNNYTISGLYINGATTGSQGLFGLNTGTIRNLKIKEMSIHAASAGSGGLVGVNDVTGKISNIETKGIIATTGVYNVGGIVGTNKGTMSEGTNHASVLGMGHVGGIVGSNTGGATITKSSNHGSISDTGTVGGIGGICGANFSNSTIELCYNKGSVVGYVSTGGIAGVSSMGQCEIKYCYNMGSVKVTKTSGNMNLGGIVGYLQDSAVYYCYNKGKLVGAVSNSYGLIVGMQVEGSPYTNYCYAVPWYSIPIIGNRKAGTVTGNEIVEDETTMTGWTEEEVTTKLTDNFVKDEDIINDGYPILKWQVAE